MKPSGIICGLMTISFGATSIWCIIDGLEVLATQGPATIGYNIFLAIAAGLGALCFCEGVD